ncbi:MAG: DUF2062 domain-containing protein [Desulfonatronovibrionaceae bacterium]
MNRLWARGRRSARFWYLSLLRIKAPAHSVAMGLAMGVFIGLLPIIPFQTVVVLVLAFAFRCSKLAAVLGTWVSNPADMVFLYYVAHRIGKFLIPVRMEGFDGQPHSMLEMMTFGWKTFGVMFIGGLAMALPAAFVTYFVSLRLIRVYHARRMARWRAKKNRKP